MQVSTTKMSTKGQIVIPEEIREQLNLSVGSQFIVIGGSDSIILKTIETPSPERFRKLCSSVRSAAKKSGLKQKDIADAIKKVRYKK